MMFKTPVSSHRSALIRAGHLKEAIFMLLFVRDHRPLIWRTADLTIQFAFCVTICNAQAKGKLTGIIGFTASHNQQIAYPIVSSKSEQMSGPFFILHQIRLPE